MTLYTLNTRDYVRASDVRLAQPHILRNRINRISHELKFALPATVPTQTECRAIVPYEPPCLAIVPYKEPKPKPPKIIPYPVAVGRKSPILPYPKPPKRQHSTRPERARIFAEALKNPNLTVDDLCALSDELLMQSAYETYHGA